MTDTTRLEALEALLAQIAALEVSIAVAQTKVDAQKEACKHLRGQYRGMINAEIKALIAQERDT